MTTPNELSVEIPEGATAEQKLAGIGQMLLELKKLEAEDIDSIVMGVVLKPGRGPNAGDPAKQDARPFLCALGGTIGDVLGGVDGIIGRVSEEYGIRYTPPAVDEFND